MIKLVLLAAAATLAMTTLSPASRAAAAETRQYFEVRIYQTKSADQQQRINDYWQNAAVAAYNRQGIQPIGVFTEVTDSPTNSVYVLIPCDSIEVWGAIPGKLAADAEYQRAAAPFLSATKSNPAYERIESSLLVAFEGMKHLVPPAADKKPNVFELRTYMSPSEDKGRNKIQMFEKGEITLMKDIGMSPVFYGQKLIGPNLPCLMYMTCAASLEEQAAHWKTFGDAPVWKALLADPYYKDNMNGTIKIMLKRMAASQI